MPRVFTATAAKDYPNQGIQKGDQYFYWTPYREGKRRSKNRPSPSQVESNATRAAYLSLREDAENSLDSALTVGDIVALLEDASSDAQSIVDELREKASNIEEGFGHETEQSAQFNEQADDVEGWISDLGNVDRPDEPEEEPTKPERKDFPDGEIGDTDFDGALVNYEDNHAEWQEAVDGLEDTVEDFRSEASTALGDAPDI